MTPFRETGLFQHIGACFWDASKQVVTSYQLCRLVGDSFSAVAILDRLDHVETRFLYADKHKATAEAWREAVMLGPVLNPDYFQAGGEVLGSGQAHAQLGVGRNVTPPHYPSNYCPTSPLTPNPVLLATITPAYCNRWVPVTEALPPPKFGLIVQLRGDDSPAVGYLKFGAGDRNAPYFVVPQSAAIGPRDCEGSMPKHAQGRTDATHWWTASEIPIPLPPEKHFDAPWGLHHCGWETAKEPLNPVKR